MRTCFVSLVTFLGLMAAGLIYANQAATPKTAQSNDAAPPQTETKAPAFEVVAIKPSDPMAPRPDGCFMKGQPGGQTFIGRCMPLRLMITYAYKIIDSQLVGGPTWMDTEQFDFDAKADHTLTRAELAPMMQTMLAERFNLKFHTEARTMPALVLTVDKSGNKMTANTGANDWTIAIMPAPAKTMPKFKGTRCPVSYLSWWIAQRQSRPVVDKTGLDGFWDFTLEYVPDQLGEQARKGPGGEPVPPMDGPNLITALREQLGLKLEQAKAPVDVYIIDRVEKVAAN